MKNKMYLFCEHPVKPFCGMTDDPRFARVEMNMDEIEARKLPSRSTGIAPTTVRLSTVGRFHEVGHGERKVK